MEKNVLELFKKEESLVPCEQVSFPQKETREQKLLRLQARIEQGLYAPDLEKVADSLISKLVAEEEKSFKK